MSSPRSSTDSSLARSSSEMSFVEDGFDANHVAYRVMTPADAHRVKQIHHSLLDTSSTVAHIRQHLFNSNKRVFIAFIPTRDGLIIGFASASITFHGSGMAAEITIDAVGVDALYRSHGVGENLIRAVSASLLVSSMKHGRGSAEGDALVLVELKAKSKAVEYFEKLGWEREAEMQSKLPWGPLLVHDPPVRLSRWINAHRL